MTQISLTLPTSRLVWIDRTTGHYECPTCRARVWTDGRPDAEVEADPLCCWCRPLDDARLSERIRRIRQGRTQ